MYIVIPMSFFTGDFSSPNESLMQEHICLIIDTQDPRYLQHHNKGSPPLMYDCFWDEYRKYLDEEVETAVDKC